MAIRCNDGVLHYSAKLIVPGTIGWMHRSDGYWGHLAGLMAFTGHPYLSPSGDGEVYCNGIIDPWPEDEWISGKDINAAGWTDRSPWGDITPRRHRSGESLLPQYVAILEGLITPETRDWVTDHRQP